MSSDNLLDNIYFELCRYGRHGRNGRYGRDDVKWPDTFQKLLYLPRHRIYYQPGQSKAGMLPTTSIL